MKFKIVWFFLIIAFASVLGASPVDKVTFAKANEAFVRSAKLKKTKVPMTAVPMSKLSRQRVVSNGSPTPEAPQVEMWFAGVDDDNNVHIGIDVVTKFPPVNPMRVFVNGYRTDLDATFQATRPASPGSAFKLATQRVAEIHGLEVVLPGKLGLYGIEIQVDWNEQFYHSSWYMFTLDHRGATIPMCVNEDGNVNMLFAFDTFDKEFPASVEITMNDIPLVPQGPVTIEKEGFFNFVSMTLSNEDYAELSVEAYEYGSVSFILRGDNGVIVQWEGYLPFIQELPSCGDSCYDPTTGEPGSCGYSSVSM